MGYEEFLETKKIKYKPSGFKVESVNEKLFDFQKDMVMWALRKGKAAMFTGTGTGKSACQLEWAKHVAEHTKGNVLILAPLAVAQQTVREGEKFNVVVHLCRTQEDVKPGVNISNYEMLHHFDTSSFAGIVIDESSILKAFTGKVRNQIIESFIDTPFKLACTATPSPNDFVELGNHSEFLGAMTRTEMLSTFFVHDGGETSKWRLKGHAINEYWQWVSSWAVMMSNPADLGYDGSMFDLPPLNIHEIVVDKTGYRVKNVLSLNERRAVRNESLGSRVRCAVEIVLSSSTA